MCWRDVNYAELSWARTDDDHYSCPTAGKQTVYAHVRTGYQVAPDNVIDGCAEMRVCSQI